MGKVYESDIDPDEFIRDFRESPSQTQPSKKPKFTSSDKDSPVKQKSKPDNTPQSHPQTEEEYLDCFVRNMAHMRSRKKYQVVEVDPIFIQKVKRIIHPVAQPKHISTTYLLSISESMKPILKKDNK